MEKLIKLIKAIRDAILDYRKPKNDEPIGYESGCYIGLRRDK